MRLFHLRICAPHPVQTPWTSNYPPGVPGRGAHRRLRQPGRSAGSRLPAPRQARRAGLHGQPAELRRSRPSCPLPGRLAAVAGPEARRPRRGDDAQRAAVPGGHRGHLRAGLVVVNVNPLYTARELQHQLNDSGAVAIVVLENFAHTLEEVIDERGVKHVVLASMGELLGFWYGRWINFAVRHLAKMVPEFSAAAGPRAHRDALCGGGRSRQRMTLKRPEIPRRRRLPAVHRGHHRRVQGRHAAAPQRGGQHHAVRGLVQAHARQGRRQAS
jgi:hypothetical protein